MGGRADGKLRAPEGTGEETGRTGLASELLSYQLSLTPPGVVRTDIVVQQSKVCWGGAAYGDRQIQGRGEGK